MLDGYKQINVTSGSSQSSRHGELPCYHDMRLSVSSDLIRIAALRACSSLLPGLSPLTSVVHLTGLAGQVLERTADMATSRSQ